MANSLIELFSKQYELCALKSSESVAIISEYGKKDDYVDAALSAARRVGASTVVLTASSLSSPSLPPFKPDGREVPSILAAAAECDLVVDVTVGGLIHSDVRTRITGNGKRMLFVAEPPEVLERLIGNDKLRDEVEAASEILRHGEVLHITSDAGTDLRLDISGQDLPITKQWGFVDVPGRWDHWPSGFIACFPNDRSGQGRIILQAGDVIIPWQRQVRENVELVIEDGFIVSIEGNNPEAFSLREYFEQWDDPNVYALSHAGWGLHKLANWSALDVYDPRSLYGQELRSVAGNFMWSTGSNRFANRETPAHLDVPMHSCTVKVDDRIVVNKGELV